MCQREAPLGNGRLLITDILELRYVLLQLLYGSFSFIAAIVNDRKNEFGGVCRILALIREDAANGSHSPAIAHIVLAVVNDDADD